MKKICISVLIFMMLCTIKPATALASDYEDYSFYNILQDIEVTEDNGELLIYCPHFDLAKCNLSDYQLEMIHEAGIQKYYGVSGSYSVCNGRPTHVVEAGDPVRKTFTGCMSNQRPGGAQFPTGGGFYFSKYCGDTVSFGISFPAPYNYMTVSIAFGKVGSSGYYISVPDTVHFFKAYASLTYDCRPYKVWAVDSHGNKTPYGGGVSKLIYSESYYAKQV